MNLQKSLIWLFSIYVLFAWLHAVAINPIWITYDDKKWTITISYDWESVTIADKNVWATKVWYWKDASVDSYGLYYQWWWMTGYKYSRTADESVYKWFEKDMDVYSPNMDWWTVSQQAELCGEWFHIPTRTERKNVLKLYQDNWNDLSKFSEFLKVPLGWYRFFRDAEMTHVGSISEFWTTSPNIDNYAFVFRTDTAWAYDSYGSTYAYGHPIRCIQDKNSINNFSWVSHDTLAWTITISDWKNKIIIADRNVWAMDTWYWPQAHRISYGSYYQRWWRTWYSYFFTEDEALAKGFVKTEERVEQIANLTSWDDSSICWNWYHIPSYTEWKNLIDMFKSNWNKLTDFYEAFQIPAAGDRNEYNIKSAWEWFNSYLWTSTPHANKWYIYCLSATNDNIIFVGSRPSNAVPIRCFKNMGFVDSVSLSKKSNPVNNNNVLDDETIQAHKFAYRNGITSISNPYNAKMDSNLTRIAMAKMLSQYAISVLWKIPDNKKTAKFSDVPVSLDHEYNNWVTLAYQLWIMGKWTSNFRPYDTVTRAEFATALSRLLYNVEDWPGGEYYIPHITKLYKSWIINNTDPKIIEKRWYVMLMLMRSAK